MEIDETKRITIAELANLPYFKRLMKKEPIYNTLQINPGIHGSAYDLRMRSPSYNGNDNNSKVLKSEQINHKRKISVEKSNDQFTSPFLLQTANNNIPPSPAYDKHKPSYSPSPQVGKNALDVPRD